MHCAFIVTSDCLLFVRNGLAKVFDPVVSIVPTVALCVWLPLVLMLLVWFFFWMTSVHVHIYTYQFLSLLQAVTLLRGRQKALPTV